MCFLFLWNRNQKWGAELIENQNRQRLHFLVVVASSIEKCWSSFCLITKTHAPQNDKISELLSRTELIKYRGGNFIRFYAVRGLSRGFDCDVYKHSINIRNRWLIIKQNQLFTTEVLLVISDMKINNVSLFADALMLNLKEDCGHKFIEGRQFTMFFEQRNVKKFFEISFCCLDCRISTATNKTKSNSIFRLSKFRN